MMSHFPFLKMTVKASISNYFLLTLNWNSMKLPVIGCIAIVFVLMAIACQNNFVQYWLLAESGKAAAGSNDVINDKVQQAYACLAAPAANLNFEDLNAGDAYQGNGTFTLANYHTYKENKTLAYHHGLRVVNETIQLLNAVGAGSQDQLHAIRLAEMRFLRGHFSFELKKLADTAMLTEDSWVQIEADFQSAANILPANSADRSGKPCRYAAWAYLCKAYIYQKKWSKALIAADEVINKGNYQLMPDLSDVFNVENDHNREVVFAVHALNDAGNSQKSAADDQNLVASRNLVNYYKTDDLGLPLRNYDGLAADDLVDPRLGFTLAKKELLSNNYNYVIRYPDVLLWKAEAAIQLGDFETGRQLINALRRRVKESEKIQKRSIASATSFKIEEYTTLFDCYECAMEAVKDERRLELALEGHRFSDLQRWGDK